jgi:hypothetical protein
LSNLVPSNGGCCGRGAGTRHPRTDMKALERTLLVGRWVKLKAEKIKQDFRSRDRKIVRPIATGEGPQSNCIHASCSLPH